MITPANKPQGFGFAEFEDPDGMMRAVTLLNGVELPALEEGCVSKTLLVSFVLSSIVMTLIGLGGPGERR
jgi:RNA recognition motif-containing protein